MTGYRSIEGASPTDQQNTNKNHEEFQSQFNDSPCRGWIVAREKTGHDITDHGPSKTILAERIPASLIKQSVKTKILSLRQYLKRCAQVEL